VEASGATTDVASGSCFLLGSEEAHVIHNRSADQPLFIFTTYWMPRTGPPELATASAAGSGAGEEGPS
jgi:hypothetical protein